MGNYVDLTGRKFGMWTVLGRDIEREKVEKQKLIERLGKQKANKRSLIFWKCRCVCGELGSVTSGNLLQGNSKSCGRHMPSPSNFQDLTGQVFDRLKVISRNFDYSKVKSNETVY